jgi:hypothetical protein
MACHANFTKACQYVKKYYKNTLYVGYTGKIFFQAISGFEAGNVKFCYKN